MIIKALSDYYEHAVADPSSDMPRRFWSSERVAWSVELDEDGNVLGVDPQTTGEGKAQKAFRVIQVPEHFGRSGTKPPPFFLCDTPAYVFGVDKKDASSRRAMAAEHHEALLGNCDDPGARAVVRFFQQDSPAVGLSDGLVEELVKSKGFVAFRLQGDSGWIHERPAVQAVWEAHRGQVPDDATLGQCAVTGEEDVPMARLFPQVTGFPGAQSAGASLVSFNCDAFESYGKKQAFNASISEKASAQAGPALKQLCSDLRHRVRMGDTMVVFWADRPAPLEDELLLLLLGSAPPHFEDEETVDAVRDALDRMRRGLPIEEEFDLGVTYYVLGLSPNAARLSVRFFETNTLGFFADNYARYLQDVDMVGVKRFAPFTLLQQTAPRGAADQVPSTEVNAFMQAVLTGASFPQGIVAELLTRMRADKGTVHVWDMGQRAALLKGCFNRKNRIQGFEGKELRVSLDRTNADVGYVLGRMFAIMEYAQEQAVKGANATILDKYVSAASTTPARVYGVLIGNYLNHLSKIGKTSQGSRVYIDKQFQEAVSLLPGDQRVPKTLDSDQQVEFYVGYYHQKEDLYTSKKDKQATEAEETPND